MLRELDLRDEPRAALRRIDGVELSGLGQRALLRLRRHVRGPPARAVGGDGRREAALAAAARTRSAAPIPRCLMHLRGRLRRLGMDVDVKHVAELLEEARGERPARARARRRSSGDGHLQRAIRRSTDNMDGRWRALRAELEDPDALREAARSLRSAAIARLPELLGQLADGVEAAGGQVFFAADADEATGYILRLAHRRKAKLAVKSKSMVTEEIKLNAALAAAGVEAVETDLGEWAQQLDGEPPVAHPRPGAAQEQGRLGARARRRGLRGRRGRGRDVRLRPPDAAPALPRRRPRHHRRQPRRGRDRHAADGHQRGQRAPDRGRAARARRGDGDGARRRRTGPRPTSCSPCSRARAPAWTSRPTSTASPARAARTSSTARTSCTS